MKFGRTDDLKGASFSLPPDAAITTKVLAGTKKKGSTRIYVGCPVWGEPKLVGKLYPKGTKPRDFLKIYATKFNSIELNQTGYNIPAIEEVETWTQSAGKGFKFFPKVPMQISRTAPLGKKEEALISFYESLWAFHGHLGAVFLQLAPTLSTKRRDDLLNFIAKWNREFPLFVELRHPSWFDGSEDFAKLLAAMKKHKVGTVVTDVTERRDVLHQALTVPSAFIRFDGHDLHPTDFKRLDLWADRIKSWSDKGLRDLYFFVHTPKKELNPQLAFYFIEELTNRGLTVTPVTT